MSNHNSGDEDDNDYVEEDEEEEELESDWDEDDEEDSYKGKSILWMCQEGLMPEARKRFDSLLLEHQRDASSLSTLHRQVFSVGHDGNYPLHEILMGGTSDTNAFALVLSILDFAQDFPQEYTQMLARRPRSHLRTPLHWAVWEVGNNHELIRRLVNGYPEALILRDKPDKGRRTPVEIFDRYHDGREYQPISDYLNKATQSWTRHRLRLAVHLAAHHYFVTAAARTPFDKTPARNGIKPRAWFCLSILGFLLQREMKPLALHILGFLGKGAKILDHKKATKKRSKRKGVR